MKFSPAQLNQLKEFIHLLKAQPALLQDGSLAFFRDYLRELGANIPGIVDEDMPDLEEDIPAPKQEEPHREKEQEEVEEEEVEEEPEPEEEEEKEEVDPDVIAPESDPPQPMGGEFEVTDELREKASELRQQANEHTANGEIQQAIDTLTTAITTCNPSSAPLFASRGQAYLKLKKPLSAIRDADAAIRINPDSAVGYRVRGKAKALLGEWEAAVSDLRAANQRDYDPDINDILKTITPKAQKVADKKKKKEEREKARKSKSSGHKPSGPGGFGGGPGWMPPNVMETIMQDPEFMAALSDPTVLPILNEIAANPSKIEQYKDHPKLGKLIEKFTKVFGANK